MRVRGGKSGLDGFESHLLLIRARGETDIMSRFERDVAGSIPAEHIMKGFTLIELLVVIAIIVALASIAVIAVPALLDSSSENQCLKSIQAALITTQANADLYRTRCGIRIERAYKTDGNGFMRKDSNGNALWLDYQRIKFVALGLKQSETTAIAYNQEERVPEYILLRRMLYSSIIDLPKRWWITTETAIASTSDDEIKPPNASQYSVFDNCYVIFDFQGRLHRFIDHMDYMDEDQPYGGRIPVVSYPDPSSRSLLMYNRSEYESIGKKVSVTPINISSIGVIDR